MRWWYYQGRLLRTSLNLAWDSSTTYCPCLAVGSSVVCGRACSRSPTLCGWKSERVDGARGRGRQNKDSLERKNIYNSVNASYHTVLFQMEAWINFCLFCCHLLTEWFISWVYIKPCTVATIQCLCYGSDFVCENEGDSKSFYKRQKFVL